MTSFGDARDLLTTALFDNLISEDEYLILYDLNGSKNLDLPFDEFMRFDLDEMENSEGVAAFRVHKHDLPALAEALRIPRGIQVPTTLNQPWYGRTAHASLETFIPMSIFIHDGALWKTHAGSENDNK